MQNQNEKDKKNKGSFWSNLPEIIKAFSLVIGAIGGLGGLILVLNEVGLLESIKPTPTVTPAPLVAPTLDLQPMVILPQSTPTQISVEATNPGSIPASEPTPTLTPVPKYAWAINFEYGLKEYYWKSGTRSYRIIADCPGAENDLDKRIEFVVSEQAQLFASEIVELRFYGVVSPIIGDPKLSAIHPQQKTKITLGFINLSQEQATQFVNECQVQAVLNENFSIQLSPIGPFTEN